MGKGLWERVEYISYEGAPGPSRDWWQGEIYQPFGAWRKALGKAELALAKKSGHPGYVGVGERVLLELSWQVWH